MSSLGGAVVLVACASVLACGCEDISQYSTRADESYCGNIVTGPFVRQGFGPGVRMRMAFNAERITDQPGTIATDDGLLADVAMRAIPQLANDPLSTLQFGEGRTRNLLLAADPTAGASVFVVVSLMAGGNAEVRVLRGGPAAAAGPAAPVDGGPQLFGVFPLARQRGKCGF